LKEKQGELRRAVDTVLIHFSTLILGLDEAKQKIEETQRNVTEEIDRRMSSVSVAGVPLPTPNPTVTYTTTTPKPTIMEEEQTYWATQQPSYPIDYVKFEIMRFRHFILPIQYLSSSLH
jgi:hypothetical protein